MTTGRKRSPVPEGRPDSASSARAAVCVYRTTPAKVRAAASSTVARWRSGLPLWETQNSRKPKERTACASSSSRDPSRPRTSRETSRRAAVSARLRGKRNAAGSHRKPSQVSEVGGSPMLYAFTVVALVLLAAIGHQRATIRKLNNTITYLCAKAVVLEKSTEQWKAFTLGVTANKKNTVM